MGIENENLFEIAMSRDALVLLTCYLGFIIQKKGDVLQKICLGFRVWSMKWRGIFSWCNVSNASAVDLRIYEIITWSTTSASCGL